GAAAGRRDARRADPLRSEHRTARGRRTGVADPDDAGTAAVVDTEERLMLSASGLRKRYRARDVVRDHGPDLHPGEVVGLLGPNGAGKTTCFYMIVGLVPADGGSIRLDDREIGDLPMHARARLGVGYLPQEPSVFRRLSVADNVLAILELRDD